MGKQDSEIARAVKLRPIREVAERLGLTAADLEPYGRDTAKIRSALELLKPYGIQEIVRTGRIAMAREVQPENTKTKATSGV